MKITPNQDFKHEHDGYEKGKEYEVDDGLVGRVGDCGGDVTLDVHDVRIGHESEVR